MGASTPPKLSPLDDPAAWDIDEGDRPTVVPNFDPEAFARDSEVRQRAGTTDGGEPTIEQARRLHLAGEDESALFLLTRLLELAPLHPEANLLTGECRAALERQCLSAIGSEDAILAPSVSPEELMTFALDHVSGFLFSLVDGATKVDDVLDISGLPRLLALRHLRTLIERGLVGIASGQAPVAAEPSSSRSPVKPRGDDAVSAVESSVVTVHVGTPTNDAVPILLVAPEDLDALGLDPEVRALLDLVDDGTNVEHILAATGMDPAEALAMLERLATDGILTFV